MNLPGNGMADRSALSDRVYELLKTRIIDLVLGPGERLNVERLGAELGVSQTPVREALNRLAAEGIVSAASYRGFRVSPLLDFEDLVRLLSARRVIETAAAAEAACGDVELHELSDLVADMDRLTAANVLDVKTFNAADASFHRTVVAASGNRFFLQAFDSLHVHVQIARHYQSRSFEEAHRANEEHQRLLAAFAAGDGEDAARQAGLHVDGVMDRLRSRLGGQSEVVEGKTR